MEVTLKKAAELSRGLIAAAKAVKITTIVSISAYSVGDIAPVVERAGNEMTGQIDRTDRLLEAAYALRTVISGANSANDVDMLLTEVAKIDEKIAIRTGVLAGGNALETVFSYDGVTLDNGDLDTITRRVETVRKVATLTDPSESRRGIEQKVDVNLLSNEQRSAIEDEITVLKRDRAGVKDKITMINFSTRVNIPETIAALLKEEKLI